MTWRGQQGSDTNLSLTTPSGELIVGDAPVSGPVNDRIGRKFGARSCRAMDLTRRLHAAAAARGGRCLDEYCTKAQAKYRFRCARGHEWLGWGHLVLSGKWCRQCAYAARRLPLEEMQDLARSRGGACLSTEFLGCRTVLLWSCEHGHTWEATPHAIKHRNRWCPACYGRRVFRASTHA